MDDIPLCPPYWPELIWRLIHHLPPIPDPDPDPVYRSELFRQLDSHFASIAVEALSGRVVSEKLGRQIGELAAKAGPTPEPWATGFRELATSGR
jgi:hypothetical protein